MIDVHCHLDAKHTSEKLEKIFATGNLYAVISSGIKPSSWQKHIDLKKKYPINIALGIHPFFVEDNLRGALKSLEIHLNENVVLAIGEIGLDYHKEKKETRQFQLDVFEKQLELANTYNLPIIIHCRKAHADLFKVLKMKQPKGIIIHSFSGGAHELKTALDLGAYISFGFPITYENNKKQKQILKETPLERIVFETDAPYMKMNNSFKNSSPTPLDIDVVYKKASEILKMPVEALKKQVQQNIMTLFPHILVF